MSWYQDNGGASHSVRGDAGTIPVAALVPIRATAASRPLRRLARALIVGGVICAVLSVIGSLAWIVVVSNAIDFAQEDIIDANDTMDRDIHFDLETETRNLKLVLSLAGAGVGGVGVALGAVIIVIGGVARQLDQTLAPIDSPHGDGAEPMAAVAYRS